MYPKEGDVMRSRLRPITLAIAMLALLVAACGQAGMAPGEAQPEPAASDAAAQDQLEGGTGAGEDPAGSGEATTGGGPAGEEGNAAPIEQRIIKTGEVTVQVTDVPATVGRVRALVLELGGYVGGSQAGAGDEGATLTLRIPAARFDEALERLRALDGEVVAEATRESDVTRQ